MKVSRRSLLAGSAAGAMAFSPRSLRAGQTKTAIRPPAAIGSPVLEGVMPVIERSRHVRTDVAKVIEHAGWMAYEDLPMPEMSLPFGLGKTIEEAIDFVMVSTTINTAFTDFRTAVKFEVEFEGRRWSDSDAMVACLKRALDAGRPILDGAFLATLDRATMADIFRGNIEIPMLDEKLRVLKEVGRTLVDRYDGHFHRFVRSGPPRLYAGGKGLIERLVVEFPRFNDVSVYDGHEVKIFKLAQLGYWGLYSARYKTRDFPLEDASTLTAFADYILPVALRLMNIFVYESALERAINDHRLIPRDSPEEIELRAHTIYATALMREEVNKLRPPGMAVIIPQIDARLWTHYHKTFWPHHLTETIMY
jgi:hypothetical protein